MAFVGNLLWFIFGGGFFACIAWCLLGCLLAITVIGIPFAIAAFRIAGFAAFPFGKELVDGRLLGQSRIAGTGLANFLWVVLAGLWLAISHVLAGIACLLAFPLIVPIFFGLAHFILAGVSFAPLGKVPVSKDFAAAARARNVSAQLGGTTADGGAPPLPVPESSFPALAIALIAALGVVVLLIILWFFLSSPSAAPFIYSLF